MGPHRSPSQAMPSFWKAGTKRRSGVGQFLGQFSQCGGWAEGDTRGQGWIIPTVGVRVLGSANAQEQRQNAERLARKLQGLGIDPSSP